MYFNNMEPRDYTNDIVERIIRGFLQSIASGMSLETFIDTNEHVISLKEELVRVGELFDENENMLNQVRSDLAERSTQAADNFDQRNQMIRTLLNNALSLLSEGNSNEDHQPEVVRETPLRDSSADDQSDTDTDDFRSLYDSSESADRSDVDQRPSMPAPVRPAPVEEPSDNEDDFSLSDDIDLEDEDLDDLVDVTSQASPSQDISKHPNITENFIGLEDSNMIMLVYVKYSHLPYHYVMSGSRYKLTLNGSQLISTVV